jgi:hypothetical protein
MLADMAEWGAINQEYVRHFPGELPARSAFGTGGLARVPGWSSSACRWTGLPEGPAGSLRGADSLT